MQGTQDNLHKSRADHTDIKALGVDWKDKTTGINKFDDRGNYKAFEKYLTETNSTDIINSFSSIAIQVKNYKPSPETSDANDDINLLKN
jgi:hypothetical protein